MKKALVIIGPIALALGLMAVAAGLPMCGYQGAAALNENTDLGTGSKSYLGHVRGVYSVKEAIEKLNLPSRVESTLKQVVGKGKVVTLKECEHVFIYARTGGLSKGDRVAVKGYVYSAGGKGLVLGSSLIGSLLKGQKPQPAAVDKVPFWYFYAGIAFSILGLGLLVLGIIVKAPERPPLAYPAAQPPMAYPPGQQPPMAYPPGQQPPQQDYPAPPQQAYPAPPQQAYPAPPPQQVQPVYPCPKCGQPLAYYPQTRQWYCPSCGQVL